MKIIDISIEIKEKMLTYPGDPLVKIKNFFKIPEKKVNLSIINFGSHTGTHIDAPLHIKNNGKSITEIALNNFYGKCKVIEIKNKKEILKKDLIDKEIENGEIILLKTKNSENLNGFNKKFVYLTPDAARYLVEKKIKLIGIDYLSVERFGSGTDVHNILLEKMLIIEGLDLKQVRPGRYVFVGFPLKINCDGSPIRACLIKK